ncbi:TRAP transporter small permease [Oceanicella sp. SM1341]|uniref:TRAP transporter small permease n=1 Tax=Oceanicella sp. SM1341 TaxID=1548889 RepID=UPI000E486CB3|nr:TRAP transporter small permease subunit [Oceanicella sp. SM1341]
MLARIDRCVGHVFRAIPIACLAALFVLLLVNVVARSFSLASFPWFDEVVQGLFAWMVFTGAAALWREKDHFAVDWLPLALTGRPAQMLHILLALLSICFLAAMTWYGFGLARSARALTPILEMPVSLFYAAIPLSGAVMLACSLADLVRLITTSPARPEVSA